MTPMLSISGRLAVGETIHPAASADFDAHLPMEWQVLLDGKWTTIGLVQWPTYSLVVPESAAGLSLRLAATLSDGTLTTSVPSAPVWKDAPHNAAPGLSGNASPTAIIIEEGVQGYQVRPVPGNSSDYTDSDGGSIRGTTITFMNSNSLAHGGDGTDQFLLPESIRSGAHLLTVSGNSLVYTAGNGKVYALAEIDPVLNGVGNDLRITFNQRAQDADVDAVLRSVEFLDGPTHSDHWQILTTVVQDEWGAAVQRTLAPAPWYSDPGAEAGLVGIRDEPSS